MFGGGVTAGLASGIFTAVPQALHRTVFPRADSGTASTLRQIRFGHNTRTLPDAMVTLLRTPTIGLIGLSLDRCSARSCRQMETHRSQRAQALSSLALRASVEAGSDNTDQSHDFLPGVFRMPSVRPSSTAVIGLQWGDEGKGKLVDVLGAQHHAVVRYNGGANAGHSIVIEGQRFAVHLIPVGIFMPGVLAVIGNGVVVDPETLVRELDTLSSRGIDTSGLRISSRAHVVMPYHKLEDAAREEQAGERGKAIGTTRRGIGPAYADKAHRRGAIRMIDLLDPQRLAERIEEACRIKAAILPNAGSDNDPHALFDRMSALATRLGPMICDTTYLLHDMLAEGKRLLFEGANATLLDVDHGTYPYVTASSASALGIAAGSGVPMNCVNHVIGVAKAYSTRVGSGPMPTELHDDTAHRIRERGREYGTTTGRPRRVGWIDLVALRYAAMVNGITHIAVTLLDVLEGIDELRLCTAYRTPSGQTDRFPADGRELAGVEPVYETLPGFFGDISQARTLNELPEQARTYLARIEEFVRVPVGLVSVGPDRRQIIDACGILGSAGAQGR